MAKSKSGGTRSYIRGRVGADVYSVGKDAKGKKQQVVRSLAETVANPQTLSQMRGRMIMSTIMQAVAALKAIIDHSFDNVVGRQPNISEFIARNYALVKADVQANPSGSNAFGLNMYQEKGAKRGAYIISDGAAAVPAALVLAKASGIITITMDASNITIGDLKSALGMTNEEYFTLVGIGTDGKAYYERFRVNPTMSDDTALSASNIGDAFAVEGNAVAEVAIASNVINLTLNAVAGCCDVIVTKKGENGYIHSQAILGDADSFDYTSDMALPTYPVGNADYLNGGDIFGQSESFNPAPTPSPTPTPSVSAPTINGTTPFTSSTSVTMSAESGAQIRYTTNGTTPTASSQLYSSAITLSATTTIKAIAIKDGVSSSVATKTFTKSGDTPTPSVNAPSINGTTPFETSTSVTMSAESGAEIRYTTDGSTPNASSQLYSSAITLSATTTVKAIAIKDGVSSNVTTKTFTKSSQPVGDLTITVDGTAVERNSVVTLDNDAVVVVTLPAGHESIGKAVGIYGGSAPYPNGVTLTAGANTFTLEKSKFDTSNKSWGAGQMEEVSFSEEFNVTFSFIVVKTSA